jgi:serine O-acetyltransferase
MGMPTQARTWEEHSANADYVESAARAAGTTRVSTEGKIPPISLRQLMYRDYRRYRAAGARNALSVIAMTQGFWASTIFRVSHWALVRCRIAGLRSVVKAICLLSHKFIEVVTGICIPAGCNIGPGLYIGHFSGIFVDSDARIGENCNLAQGVTIGKGGRGELHGVPILGDRVHMGANAIILGKITIGNDAVIGPGAVVMNSVPPCGVAMGNPARVIGLSGSFDFVHYDGMEKDPQRKPELHNPDDEKQNRAKE